MNELKFMPPDFKYKIAPGKINLLIPMPKLKKHNYLYIGFCNIIFEYVEILNLYQINPIELGYFYGSDLDINQLYNHYYIKSDKVVLSGFNANNFIISHGEQINDLYEHINNNYILNKIL